jgi:hypothetical protein
MGNYQSANFRQLGWTNAVIKSQLEWIRHELDIADTEYVFIAGLSNELLTPNRA